jgi:hypothetical protein
VTDVGVPAMGRGCSQLRSINLYGSGNQLHYITWSMSIST